MSILMLNNYEGLIEFSCRMGEPHPTAYEGTPSGEVQSAQNKQPLFIFLINYH